MKYACDLNATYLIIHCVLPQKKIQCDSKMDDDTDHYIEEDFYKDWNIDSDDTNIEVRDASTVITSTHVSMSALLSLYFLIFFYVSLYYTERMPPYGN